MAREFHLPDIGEGLTEAEIVSWHVGLGDRVEADQLLVEVETAKAVVEITSPFSGTVLHLGGDEGTSVQVGSVLVVIGEPGETWDESAMAGSAAAAGAVTVTSTAGAPPPVRAMPIVRKLAADLGVDLTVVSGTGPGGSITRSDVEAAAASAGPGTDERIPVSRMRRRIAEHMARSWREIPHVTVQAEVRAAELLAARAELGGGGSPAPLEAVVARCVLPVLTEFPEFNATLDGADLIIHHRRNLGFAVDTEEGLVVTVVRDADTLTTAELAAHISDLAARAKQRTVTPDEVSGQTFTISNIGALGGGHGTPIIPWGTTAILSVGRVADEPIVDDGSIVIAPMMPIDLSYDHRVIDGGLGQRFLGRLLERLEHLDDLG